MEQAGVGERRETMSSTLSPSPPGDSSHSTGWRFCKDQLKRLWDSTAHGVISRKGLIQRASSQLLPSVSLAAMETLESRQ